MRERVDAALEAAIGCAQRQGSRMFELRATTMLARLAEQGERTRRLRARLGALLAELRAGNDTADVVDARRSLAG